MFVSFHTAVRVLLLEIYGIWYDSIHVQETPYNAR